METPQTIEHVRVRPFSGRIAIIPSPVDEEEQPSGLVLPISVDSTTGVERGIVQDVAGDALAAACELPPGTVVYYTGGTKIRGLVILDPEYVLAYEEQA